MIQTPKNTTYARVRAVAFDVFGHDMDKVNIWWMTKSPAFDDISPFEMVKIGKGRMVMRYLDKYK